MKGIESPKAKVIDAFSTETDTPPNEKLIEVNQKAFKFTNDDLDTAST